MTSREIAEITGKHAKKQRIRYTAIDSCLQWL